MEGQSSLDTVSGYSMSHQTKHFRALKADTNRCHLLINCRKQKYDSADLLKSMSLAKCYPKD